MTVSMEAPRVKTLNPNSHEQVKLFYSAILAVAPYQTSTSYAQKKVMKNDDDRRAMTASRYWRGACEAIEAESSENSGMFKVDFVFTPDFGGDI